MNRKQLKTLEQKALLSTKNNPAKILLEAFNKGDDKLNPLVKAMISGKKEEYKNHLVEDNYKEDDYGFNALEYASILENKEVFAEIKSNSDLYTPVFGEVYKDEAPLLKNLAFDKKTVMSHGNYFLYSPYNFKDYKNFNQAVKAIFENAGKRTFKLMSPFFGEENVDFTVFHFAHYCSVYFKDANHFNEILEEVENVSFYEHLIPLHFIMSRMTEARLKSFIIDAGKMNTHKLKTYSHDTLVQYKGILKACHDEYEIDFKAITTLKQLHDSIMEDYKLISRHGENMMLFLERKFPYLERLKEQEFRGMKIIIPKDKATLIEWGTRLNNCIGGYGDCARDGRTIIFGLEENGQVSYNIEIRPENGAIRQFVADANRCVEQEMREELQALIDEHKDNVVLEDGETVVRLPIDNRFLVKVLKIDSPVDEQKSMFNEMFMLNLGKKVESQDSMETTKIGFKEDIPRGAITLLLEDKNSKAKLVQKLSTVDKKVAYAGLLRYFKQIENATNMKQKDSNLLTEDMKAQLKKGVKTFYIGLNKIVTVNGKTPSALSEKDIERLNKEWQELLQKGCNIFLVQGDVQKAKFLKYNNSKALEKIAHQVMYSYQSKAIDNNIKVDVIKNIYGTTNTCWSVKK